MRAAVRADKNVSVLRIKSQLANRENILIPDLYLRLRDRDPMMVVAWSQSFGGIANCEIGVGDVTAVRVDAAVSPANSFGYMDGGVDLAYRNYFGLGVQATVQQAIARRCGADGLPVGQALIVATGSKRIPRLIVAPTMKTPRDIRGTDYVYQAFRAALNAVAEYNARIKADSDPIHAIVTPGLGVGVCRMDHFDAADQMLRAYEEWIQTS